MASATGTSGWGGKWVAVCLVVATCAGCRGCTEDKEAAPDARVAQPTMPPGMLMPAQGGEASASAGNDVWGNWDSSKGGAWVELQNARPGDEADRKEFTHWNDDSWFVSLDVMTQLHEPFARALPGFDLFLPRLFPPEALVKLADELAAYGRTAGGDLAGTANELARIVTIAAAKKQSLWVLGPP